MVPPLAGGVDLEVAPGLTTRAVDGPATQAGAGHMEAAESWGPGRRFRIHLSPPVRDGRLLGRGERTSEVVGDAAVEPSDDPGRAAAEGGNSPRQR